MFRQAFVKTKPVIFKPTITIEVVKVVELQSAIIGSLNSHRGTIINSESCKDHAAGTCGYTLLLQLHRVSSMVDICIVR
jgi:translation elongation factor EF-G